MKKIAAILLLIFTLVQAGPAVTALFSESTTIFIVDEEKADEKIEIGGHTDNIGSKVKNQKLSEDRANSVRA